MTVVVLVSTLLAPSPAAAEAKAEVVASSMPAVIQTTSPRLHPEGIAWDPTRQAFLVSSITHGTVSVVDRAGRTRTLVSDPHLISTFGIHVDARRSRVLVTYGDMGVADRSTPETAFTRSGVGIYDLRTGRLLHRVDLNTAQLNPNGGRHAANDLAIDALGNAYVTDPAGDAVYRITVAGKASVLVRDAQLASPTIGLNGIAWHPAGYLLAMRYDTGQLFRITTAGHFREVPTGQSLAGADGLAFGRNGLYVVTNHLAAPSGVEAVTVLRSADGFRTARAVRRTPWPVKAPTTIALTPYGGYVVSGNLDLLLAGTPSDEFTLRRV
ncbi:SMP-30/gluconolactonase/LRE family protein [Kribbella sp. NBC_01245]|uniref:SMP-30/gluconolactonase/LRE family protein n=1 Tax=Kribbella sp. NBC_01245 TaxID=2903578 RepID=UPI002E293C9E|nr:SMP-30/gluconolactonase/LRE family protein [Kribbella sp. NBC_01245]